MPGVALEDVRSVGVLTAARCGDDRYPALAGHWVVGCVGDDRVNVAVSLQDGRMVTLTAPVLSPGLGDGWLWAPGRSAGAWVLPQAVRGPIGGVWPPTVPFQPLVPPALALGTAVVAYADHVEAVDLTASTWPRFTAAPLPAEPVAVGDGWAAWTQAGEARDVWIVALAGEVGGLEKGRPTVIGGGPEDQHHVAGAARSVWWVEPDQVVRYDVDLQVRSTFPADTGFMAGLAVNDDGTVACWEDRAGLATGGDIDIRCSSGLHLERAGDQRWPSMGGVYLMWREGRQVVVGRMP